jgi:hypothetical protein
MLLFDNQKGKLLVIGTVSHKAMKNGEKVCDRKHASLKSTGRKDICGEPIHMIATVVRGEYH